MSALQINNMAQWVWATQHPYLYTLIEISTPTILLIFIASKIITTLGQYLLGNKK